MQVRLWGVRGSYPTPLSTPALHDKLRVLLAEVTATDLASPEAIEALIQRSPHARVFGGNTSCIEVSFGHTIFVLDAGSGITPLSSHIMANKLFQTHQIHLFLTHFHWDHICGFPFFAPIYVPGQSIDIHSARADTERLLAMQMNDAYFPAKWETLPSEIRCRQLTVPGPNQVAEAEVSVLQMAHPDSAWGYRIEHDGKAVCYLTDTEISKNPDRWAKQYADFVEGAAVVIVDAAYGFLEFHEHINWGHSTIFTWIDFFRESNIGELVIFHHDPLADDPSLLKLYDSASRYRQLVAPDAPWRLTAAHEGQTWQL